MIGQYLRWSASRDATTGHVWTRVVWIAVATAGLTFSIWGLATNDSNTGRLINVAATAVNAALLIRWVGILRVRLASRQYVTLTRDVKAAMQAMPDGPSLNRDAEVVLVHRTYRLAWWWPVRVDSVMRMHTDSLDEVAQLDSAAVVWESFSARRDGSPIMRSVDGMRVTLGADGELAEDRTGGSRRRRGLLRGLASGLHDMSAEELAELRAQIAGAEPVSTEGV